MYTLTPKAGDIVRVRLRTGEAVDAEYYYRGAFKLHFVLVNGISKMAQNENPSKLKLRHVVRLIYPLSLMPKPEIKTK